MSLTRRIAHIRGESADVLTDLVIARDRLNDEERSPYSKAQLRGAARDMEKALVLIDRAKGKLIG